MGKKNLDLSAFMGSSPSTEQHTASSDKQAITPVGTEKDEMMNTSYRLPKSFVKEFRKFAIDKEVSTSQLIVMVMSAYIKANK